MDGACDVFATSHQMVHMAEDLVPQQGHLSSAQQGHSSMLTGGCWQLPLSQKCEFTFGSRLLFLLQALGILFGQCFCWWTGVGEENL